MEWLPQDRFASSEDGSLDLDQALRRLGFVAAETSIGKPSLMGGPAVRFTGRRVAGWGSAVIAERCGRLHMLSLLAPSERELRRIGPTWRRIVASVTAVPDSGQARLNRFALDE
jgi:hypothetical protein